MTPSRSTAFAILLAVAIAAAGCATLPPPAASSESTPNAPAATAGSFAPLPPAQVQERLLALDPDHISDRDVRDTLAKGPAPRIVLLHGGVFPVYLLMKSFGVFLVRMGYPESRIRDPGSRDWSYSPYADSARVTGMLAWDYERTGLRPMLVGHSQGGMEAVKILHELAGDFSPSLHVFNPLTGQFEDRTTIIDPYTRHERPVVGLSVAYATAIGAGGLALLLPNQWSMVDRLRTIPDTVDEFTGFSLDLDPIALDFPDSGENYRSSGRAKVRNVELPVEYDHIFVPQVADLARDPAVSAWINAWVPGGKHDMSGLSEDAQRHVLWAADVWYSIKRHWCLEAQHLVRARNAGQPAAGQPAAG
jgi:hypothetical protein